MTKIHLSLLLLLLFTVPCAAAETDAEPRKVPTQLSAEDQEILKIMELLEMLELLDNMDDVTALEENR